MNAKKSVQDIDVAGKRVFVRADFNVPLDEGCITDDTRIRSTVPTIQYLLNHGASVILASHLGRPEGKIVETLSLEPVARRLTELLGRLVPLAPDSVGLQVESLASALKPGEVLLLENLRFHPEEEANDPAFSKELASLADVYIDDAFGSAHRAHASTAGIAVHLPAVAGLLMAKELETLGGVLDHPDRPLAAIIGGAKISTKIGVLQRLLDVADVFVIGGGMANTLLKAEGKSVGDSLVEDDRIDVARSFLQEAQRKERPVHLPIDAVVSQSLDENAESREVPIDDVPSGWKIVDIGPNSIADFAGALANVGTIIWNGPMGVFEIPQFAAGTRAIALAVAESGAKSIVGGGDSVAAVEQMGLAEKMTFISTGGGATLEFLEGRDLPGVAVLQDR